MSMMTEATRSEATSSLGYTTAHATTFRIKRLGARPLMFQGSELAMAMSFTPSIPYWYEINIYRTIEQKFVLAIRLFFQSQTEENIVHAWEFDSLPDALDKMESYDAAQDVHVVFDATKPMSVAELTATAMEIHAKIAAARSHYAGLVGEFFYDLEQE